MTCDDHWSSETERHRNSYLTCSRLELGLLFSIYLTTYKCHSALDKRKLPAAVVLSDQLQDSRWPCPQGPSLGHFRGPVVKTQCFKCRECGFNIWLRTRSNSQNKGGFSVFLVLFCSRLPHLSGSDFLSVTFHLNLFIFLFLHFFWMSDSLCGLNILSVYCFLLLFIIHRNLHQ